MKTYTHYLDEQDMEKLDRLAREGVGGKTRSELVRIAIREYIGRLELEPLLSWRDDSKPFLEKWCCDKESFAAFVAKMRMESGDKSLSAQFLFNKLCENFQTYKDKIPKEDYFFWEHKLGELANDISDSYSCDAEVG